MNAPSRRVMNGALACVHAAVPLFPSFIVLSAVAFPGVALLPRSVTLAILAFVACLASYAGVMLARYPQPGRHPLLLPMLAWLAAAFVAALVGFDPAGGLLFVAIFGLGVVWNAALMRFYAEPGAARAIFWGYLLSALVSSAIAIVMVLTRAPAAQYAIQHGRATGTFILPGELAAYLVVLLPIAYALARVAREPALRRLAWATLAVGGVALILTFSRAGWMGCAASAAFLAAFQTRHSRHGAAIAAAIVACGVGAVLLVFNVHHNPSEDYTRISIWHAATEIINRFPLTGVGPFDFSRLYALVRAPDGDANAFHAHSLYLTFFAELGSLGLAAAVWMCWRFVVELRARLAAAGPAASLLAIGIAAGLLGVAVQGLIDTMSVVIFGLWLPTTALALCAARSGLGDPPA